MNNKSKIIATVTMLAVLTVTLSSVELAYGSNSEPWKWSSADQHYKCTSSLNSITKTSNVSACGDLNHSSNVWEGITGSNWDLDQTSGGHAVYAWNNFLPAGVGGETAMWFSNGIAYYSYIVMNRDLSWEDSAQDTSTSGHDWRTFTGHEFGHLAGVAHGSSSSVMKASISPDTVQRSPTTHDDSIMAGMY